MLCGAEDAMENAVAIGWHDPYRDKWDTEEHRRIVEEAQNSCPHTKEGEDPYKIDIKPEER